MAFAVEAAKRGHRVTLFEAAQELGGQLNMAKKVPGQAEFNEMLRYFHVALNRATVAVHLGTEVTADDLAKRVKAGEFDHIVLATGVVPREPNIEGLNHPKVVTYIDVLGRCAAVGDTVAIIGAGGIGFDIAEYLVGSAEQSLDPATFMDAWGVDATIASPGGLKSAKIHRSTRTVHMFQRKSEALGKNLGKSTGWILKAKLRKAQVAQTAGASYQRIDDQGLHIAVNGEHRVIDADTIVLCAGQLPNRTLFNELAAQGVKAHLIGGADVAAELDAQRAIDQATRLAISF
jgi:2,4-dienoyl-CoA reductase (NADPH2)